MNLQELEQKYQELGKEIERLKNSEVKYPIYCRNKETNSVVKFISLKEGIYLKQSSYMDFGDRSDSFVPHTDTDMWQQLKVCPQTGLYDGQLVWFWNDGSSHERVLRFYDAKNKCSFLPDGKRYGLRWGKYEPYEGNYPDWAQKAFETLEIDYEQYN